MNSISASLRIAITVLIVLMLGLAGATWYSLSVTEKAVLQLTDNSLPASQDLAATALAYQRTRRYEKEYFVFLNNKERRDGYSKQWGTATAATSKQLDAIVTNADKRFTREESSRAREWQGAFVRYTDGFKAVRAQVDAGAITEAVVANAANGPNVDFVRPFDKEAPEMAGAHVKKAQEAVTALKANLTTLRNVMFALIALVIAYLLFLAVTLPKKVTDPLAQFSEAAERMSRGDVRNPMDSGGVAEFAKLEVSMERLRKALGMMLERMRKT